MPKIRREVIKNDYINEKDNFKKKYTKDEVDKMIENAVQQTLSVIHFNKLFTQQNIPAATSPAGMQLARLQPEVVVPTTIIKTEQVIQNIDDFDNKCLKYLDLKKNTKILEQKYKISNNLLD
jgi:hypothetical protein